MSLQLPRHFALPMSPTLYHECTRVPVTALASCGALLVAAEGPFLRFYHAKNFHFISSKRVFKAQAVHGISAYSEEHGNVTKLVIWGGRLVRALELNFIPQDQDENALHVCLSTVAKALDWILDLAPRPRSLDNESKYQQGTCAAITAHNALLEVTISHQSVKDASLNTFVVSISELTQASRSILYSAHLFWESIDRVLVAAGTAFGEIMYWSWNQGTSGSPITRVHCVFLGHEGSIFGVQISERLPSGCCQHLTRVVASCSDDRTVRIWDLSDTDTSAETPEILENDKGLSGARHTGFSSEPFDASQSDSSSCLAIGWGHASRIWKLRFLECSPCTGTLLLLSVGEDATSRTWELVHETGHNRALPFKLLELDNGAYHAGKNIWSTAICRDSTGIQQVVCGAADSKLTARSLGHILYGTQNSRNTAITEHTVQDILALTHPTTQKSHVVTVSDDHKSSRKAEFFRSYCFIDENTFLLTTNSGKVLLDSLEFNKASGQSVHLSKSTFIAQPSDLSGYSICTSTALRSVAFIAGAKGSIYIYNEHATSLTKMDSLSAKIGDMFAADVSTSFGKPTVALLATLVGQKEARLLYVNIAHEPYVFQTVVVPISEYLTGSLITSMVHVKGSGRDYLILGFRRGSIAICNIRLDQSNPDKATLFRIIEKAHGDETVTSQLWIASSEDSPVGHLLSVGRDGRLAVHYLDLSANLVELVHSVILPIGPSLEGVYLHDDHLLVHGFSSKKWILYDVTAEEEVLGVETGGAHRSWSFKPRASTQGGTLVWTRASNMHIYSQTRSSHTVIRSGGHGREIKAVAVLPYNNGTFHSRLIATGAEDTDIKLFQYVGGELICRRTLRKHTTGIQHLQWSEDGCYLFSSGGCEEFYVWRVRSLPSFLDTGVVCEYVFAPESEHSDLRIMSFDVTSHGSAYMIAMVFSDSSLKTYRYDPTAAIKWQPVAKGIYFTSCLTQCVFLSPLRILTAGTDGHAVIWPLSFGTEQGSTSTSSTPLTLTWQHPTKIHQNSSKVMVSYAISSNTTLIVSGGDDSSLAFLLAWSAPVHESASLLTSYTSPRTIVNRAHASAVTACAVLTHQSRLFVLTSGNDEWVRLWEVTVHHAEDETTSGEAEETAERFTVQRMKRIKTSVADVSSMAVFDEGGGGSMARVLVCGVGMEVIQVDWVDEDVD